MTSIENGVGAGMQFMGNPELDAQNYARQKGISLEEAKAELKAQYGDPQPPRMVQPGMTETGTIDVTYRPQSGGDVKVSPEQTMLIQKGIPAEVIIQGDDAIRKYAQDNNISLPAKNQPAGNNVSEKTETEETNSNGTQELLTRKEKHAWIKNYKETHNCSSREAYDAFYSKFGIANMSRKDAKAWMKNYSEENGVSKKEAKAAFEKEHGYSAPSSKTSRFFKGLLLMAMTPVALPLGIVDSLSKNTLGFNDAIADFTGDNNVRYKAKTSEA